MWHQGCPVPEKDVIRVTKREGMENMNKLKIALVTGLTALLLMLLLPSSVGAAGLALGPTSLAIDATAGGEYQEMIYIKFSEAPECLIHLSASGETSDWVTFYNLYDPGIPLETVTAIPGEWIYVLAKFNVPSDAVNGTTTGELHVQTAPLAEAEASGTQVVSLRASVDVFIHVVGGTDGSQVSTGGEEGGNPQGGTYVTGGGEGGNSDGEVSMAGGEESGSSSSSSTGIIIGIAAGAFLLLIIGTVVWRSRRA